ncbi:TIGR02206 family membrane protein [Cohnella lupini]|uniref:Putative integral membrane protein (TIGR02206 family) n=1 Tax=Cohnella lupini TaxID=1294267 RepID=A0A3D9IJ23_9BACL|nr:TIGR02206 family membrane protein [Cohnella lupini]RED61760.1 putative integral membrane protein (TIGR02206 family) [Cohnella lupini]
MAFEAFSLAHGLGVAIAAAILLGIVVFRGKLREKRTNRVARYALVAILVGCELSLQAWYGLTDNWGLQSLPFQLCSIMMWLSALLLLTRNRHLYEMTFFLGIMGALQALITPNLDASYPEFRYFHFFIAHGAIIGSSVFLTVIEGYRPTLGSVFRAIGWLHVLAIPAAIANSLSGSNFMFLARKPDTASMLDLLAPWPWYLLQLELVALALCMGLFGLVRVLDRLMPAKRNRSSESTGS